jgi:hypothetical protein
VSRYSWKEDKVINDGFVKSPSAALRFTFVVAAYSVSTLHSSGFARLASGAFYETIVLVTFCEVIINGSSPFWFWKNIDYLFSHSQAGGRLTCPNKRGFQGRGVSFI